MNIRSVHTRIKHILRNARENMPRTFLVVFSCVAVCSILFLHSAPRIYVVQMQDGGFVPSELTIRNGDVVVFKNVSSHAMWPASDPHPTHTDLSSFDPKKGIPPGQSWSYKFTLPGSWRFHDHLDPVSQGEIFVLSSSGKLPAIAAGGHCEGLCFDNLIRDTVRTKGIDAAYKLFEDDYAKGVLPRGCHWTAHRIGEAAYDLYREGKDFPISIATTYCGYGFYHGFMEKLLRDNPDPTYALKFCDKVNEKLGSMGLQNCYHGIGHGYTEDPPDPATVGNFEAMIQPGIQMCNFLFRKNFRNLNLCLTGVFTVPTGFAADNEYGLSIDPKNPFAVCKTQPYRYQKACYGEFAAKLDFILNWDIRKLPPYVNSLTDDKLKRLVTWVVPSVMMAKNILDPDQSQYITECRDSFTGRLRLICWGGSILGFFEHGEPNKQYEKIVAFCKSDAWQTADERTFCWQEGIRQMRQNYNKDMMTGLCTTFPEQYRHFCTDPDEKMPSPYDDPSFDTP